MSNQGTFAARKEELSRRVEALPNEIKDWREATVNNLDLHLHYSQLNAIDILVSEYTKRQKELLNNLDPSGNATTFQDTAFTLVQSIIKSQGTWDFFRDKLELRFSPKFKRPLWASDTVAWDCYNPVLDSAADLGILKPSEKREPPLTYLTAEFSAATWVRGARPRDGRDYQLGTSVLPIPVIEMPWDHIENSWEFLSLHHEVGHDLEADFGLRAPLAQKLQEDLEAAKVPDSRIATWLAWQGEIFADLVALQLGGPAFTEMLMHLLLLPFTAVLGYNPQDPHPTHYARILLNTAYIPTLIPGHQPLVIHAQEIEARWNGIYGIVPAFDVFTKDDFPLVYKALMDTPLPELKNQSLRQIIPYNLANDLQIRLAAVYILTGKNKPASIRPRYCVSAARLAVTKSTEDQTLNDQLLNDINQRTIELVEANGSHELRGGDDTTPHQKFVAGYVDKIINSPWPAA